MGKEHTQDGSRDTIESIVSVEWLAERLGREDLVIADCRFVLADPAAGRQAYERDHIPGAVFFDLERDLSSTARASGGPTERTDQAGGGGRHPLPSVEEMAEMFGRAGIGDGVTVVCYDDQKGSMAARLWWMLRYLGHRGVALLDGGYFRVACGGAARHVRSAETDSVQVHTPGAKGDDR